MPPANPGLSGKSGRALARAPGWPESPAGTPAHPVGQHRNVALVVDALRLGGPAGGGKLELLSEYDAPVENQPAQCGGWCVVITQCLRGLRDVAASSRISATLLKTGGQSGRRRSPPPKPGTASCPTKPKGPGSGWALTGWPRPSRRPKWGTEALSVRVYGVGAGDFEARESDRL